MPATANQAAAVAPNPGANVVGIRATRTTSSGLTAVAKPLTNFSGVVAQHVFSIVQSVTPTKPTETYNSSVLKAVDSLIHVCQKIFL